MTVHQGFGLAGFLMAAAAAALRFVALVVDSDDDRQLVKNLSVATAALAVLLLAPGVLSRW